MPGGAFRPLTVSGQCGLFLGVYLGGKGAHKVVALGENGDVKEDSQERAKRVACTAFTGERRNALVTVDDVLLIPVYLSRDEVLLIFILSSFPFSLPPSQKSAPLYSHTHTHTHTSTPSSLSL